jgi:lipopolysaccharide export system protein LptA
MIHNRFQILSLLTLSLLAAALPARALDSDAGEPLYIEADRVDIDDAKGISVYRGNVRITQGTMVITGDTVTFYYDEHRQLTRSVAIGEPATYRQLPEGQEEEIEAYAPRMEYLLDKDTILLLEGGRVVQGKNTFRGERIEYDMKTDKIRARSETGGSRVQVVIHPDKTGAMPGIGRRPEAAESKSAP